VWVERLGGRAIEGAQARGKHLLVRFEGDQVLHSHLGMTGA
jgi:endonuclease VIII